MRTLIRVIRLDLGNGLDQKECMHAYTRVAEHPTKELGLIRYSMTPIFSQVLVSFPFLQARNVLSSFKDTLPRG